MHDFCIGIPFTMLFHLDNVISYPIYIGVNSQMVAIITDPAGTPVDGQSNTFDYPILTNVTLMCMATAADGFVANVTSYYWNATDCYTHTDGVRDPCFYSGNQIGQSITGTNLLAQDAGTVTCTATIGDASYTSDPLTLRISGKHASLAGGITLYNN